MSSTGVKSSLVIMLLLVLLITPFPFANATEDTWTTKAPLQEARGRLGVAVVGGKIYAIGGDSGFFFGKFPSSFSFMGTFKCESFTEEYDPILDKWTYKASMPTSRYHFATAVYQNKIYCIGGLNSSGVVTGVNQVYDPATDTWETKTSMPTPRMRLDANVVDGKIYLIGGHNIGDYNYTALNLCEVYDPVTDSWTTKTVSPPYSLMNEASAVIDDKIYFLGTEKSPLPPYTNAFVETYDPKNDNWAVCGSAPVYSSSAVVGVTVGVFAPKRMHVLDENAHYVYDPATDNWTNSSLMLTSRGYAGIAVINDTLYIVGGVNLPPNNALIDSISASSSNELHAPLGYIPEFPSWIFLPLFLSVTLAVVVWKKRLPRILAY